MLVDDEEAVIKMEKQILERLGYQVTSRTSSIEALEAFRATPDKFDMIITDILMPIMNGIDMVNAIRDINYEIPIIYTTAFNDNEFLLKTVGQSIDAYILKPIDLEHLLKSIGKASLKVENERLKAKLVVLNKDLEEDVYNKAKELEVKNKKLVAQLYTDDLTNLPNRKALSEDMSKSQCPIVAIFDIDEFKGINDLYGIEVGNSVLIKIANILTQLSSDEVKVYRTGSDEFILLKNSPVYTNEYEKNIKDIMAHINSTSLYIDTHDIYVYVDVTIGMAHDCLNCLEKADIALREAQEHHLPYLMYSNSLNLESKYENEIKWTEIIREAVASKNIIPYFQPIVDIIKPFLYLFN